MIDALKLDCKFLCGACTDRDTGHIVMVELIHMAKRFGITLYCEGLDTETQLAFCRNVTAI